MGPHERDVGAAAGPGVAAAAGLGWGAAVSGLGLPGAGAGLALAAGMALHGLSDWTNTYGVTLLAPFRWRRSCGEWLFFIDAGAIAASAQTLTRSARERSRHAWLRPKRDF